MAQAVLLDVDGTLVDTNYHHCWRGFAPFASTVRPARLADPSPHGGGRRQARLDAPRRQRGGRPRRPTPGARGRALRRTHRQVEPFAEAADLVLDLKERGSRSSSPLRRGRRRSRSTSSCWASATPWTPGQPAPTWPRRTRPRPGPRRPREGRDEPRRHGRRHDVGLPGREPGRGFDRDRAHRRLLGRRLAMPRSAGLRVGRRAA